MSTYDKQKVARYKALVLQRVDNETLRCPCQHIDYCTIALATGDLLACELSDVSCHIQPETSGHAKFEDDDSEASEWYCTGTVGL